MKDWEKCRFLGAVQTYEPSNDGRSEVLTGQGAECLYPDEPDFDSCEECPYRPEKQELE